MRKLKWLFYGVILGFFAAHAINQTAEGQRLFARVNRGIAEFKKAFAAGYRETSEGEDD